MKKCNNRTSFLSFLPFAQGWQSFSVLRIWFIWWPPSESPGAHSHNHSPLKARGDLLQPCRAAGESQDCSGWVHSQGVSSTLIGGALAWQELLPWVSLGGSRWMGMEKPCWPWKTLFSIYECARAVSLWAEEQRDRTCACGQGRRKGVDRERSCLERELITMVMCLYTCGSVGEKRDQLVDWKWWESFAVLILTVFLKLLMAFCAIHRGAALFLFQACTLRKAFLWIFMVFFYSLWYSQIWGEVEAEWTSPLNSQSLCAVTFMNVTIDRYSVLYN